MRHDLNLKYLEYFVRTAAIGSFNKAAQSLYISQPHLGKIIRELEDFFGVPLFFRSNHGVTLTPEGRRVLKLASDILSTLDGIQFRSEGDSEESPHLSVSMTRFSCIMESFTEVVLRHQDHSSFIHRLYEGVPEDVCQDVLSGRSDVGVLHFTRSNHDRMVRKFTSRGLSYHLLASVEPHIILSRNHPLLLEGGPVTLGSLAPYGFIRYLGQYDDLFPDLFSQEGEQEPAKAIYVSTRGAMLHLIAESSMYSVGISDCSGSSRTVAVPIGEPAPNLMFEFGYITIRGLPLSEISMEFIEEVRSRIGGRKREAL